ncbi:MAG: CBS domain-containing protein [Pseudomonadota bacterium]
MEIITVQDLMVPLEEYVTVSENATLYEAVKSLEKAQEDLDRKRYHYLHRAILVLDGNGEVVGKISQLDVLMALEPKYKQLGDMSSLSRAGFSADFIKSMLERYALCEIPFSAMCVRAADMKVTDFMHAPKEGEFVEADTSLCEAIHMLIMGHHQSLLVTKDKKIIGILRLTDVFKQVFQTMVSHRIDKIAAS